jgi:hypothetical protein
MVSLYHLRADFLCEWCDLADACYPKGSCGCGNLAFDKYCSRGRFARPPVDPTPKRPDNNWIIESADAPEPKPSMRVAPGATNSLVRGKKPYQLSCCSYLEPAAAFTQPKPRDAQCRFLVAWAKLAASADRRKSLMFSWRLAILGIILIRCALRIAQLLSLRRFGAVPGLHVCTAGCTFVRSVYRTKGYRLTAAVVHVQVE